MKVPPLSRSEKLELAQRLMGRFIPNLHRMAQAEPTVEGKLFYMSVASGAREDAVRLSREARA